MWLNFIYEMAETIGQGGILECRVNDSKFIIFAVSQAHPALTGQSYRVFTGTKLANGTQNPVDDDLVTVNFMPKSRDGDIGPVGPQGSQGIQGVEGPSRSQGESLHSEYSKNAQL